MTALYYGESREVTYDADRVREISALEYQFPGPNGKAVTAKSSSGNQPDNAFDEHAALRSAAPACGAFRPLRRDLRACATCQAPRWKVRYLKIGNKHLQPPPLGPAASGPRCLSLSVGTSADCDHGNDGLADCRPNWGRLLYRLARYGQVSEGVIHEKIARNEDTVRYFVRFGPCRRAGRRRTRKPQAPNGPGDAARSSFWTSPLTRKSH